MGYVERCLWEYRDNLAVIEYLREEIAELQSLRVQTYEGGGVLRGGAADPVSDVCAHVLKLEQKIGQLERMTKPVTLMQEALLGGDIRICQLREILRRRYFEHEGKDKVISGLCVSEATYFRRCSELKQLARKYILP